MTIDLHATSPRHDGTPRGDRAVRLPLRRCPAALLQSARAMLDAAPRELAESFEQARAHRRASHPERAPPTPLTEAQLADLVARARAVLPNAHAPYSDFRVAAAVLDDQGRIHLGVNVENASYGLTNCAERVAIGVAVAAGAKRILRRRRHRREAAPDRALRRLPPGDPRVRRRRRAGRQRRRRRQPGGHDRRRAAARRVPEPGAGRLALRAAAASSATSCAAGIARQPLTSCPAHSGEKSPRPACSAAARSGASALTAVGNAGARSLIGPSSRISRLTMPRAGRPVNRLVSAVSRAAVALQRGAVHGAGRRLGAQQERRAELRRAGAQAQRRGHALRVGDAAGRDDRHAHRLEDRRQQRHASAAGRSGRWAGPRAGTRRDGRPPRRPAR